MERLRLVTVHWDQEPGDHAIVPIPNRESAPVLRRFRLASIAKAPQDCEASAQEMRRAVQNQA